MKSSHWIKGAFAILLALGFFITIHQPAAAAGSGACAAYTPGVKGAPSGFGSTLDTPTIRGHVIAVCSNGRNGYDSQSWNGYGDPFQCVELTNRYAAQVFGSPVADWGGDAKFHWTQRAPGWTQEENASNTLQVAGDIIVWGPVDANGNPDPNANGDPGHIAIIYTTTRTSATTWSVVAVNQNFSVSSSSPPISRSTGTITQVRVEGKLWYIVQENNCNCCSHSPGSPAPVDGGNWAGGSTTVSRWSATHAS